MAAVLLPYGCEPVLLKLEHPYTVFVPALPHCLPDPAVIVEEALDNPLGSLRLEDICRPQDRVLIVASDITRPVPYAAVLPPLLERLRRAGVGKGQITVIFANGTHRLMSREDAQAILGETLAHELHWVNHNALEKKDLVYLGTTSRGTPVWVNRLAVEADQLILTGSVVHHYFAGFGGGRKCLVPGIAGMETTLANHKLVLGNSGRGLHPGCTPGNLTGNPVHEDIIEACKMLPPDFLLNVVLDPEHSVLKAVAGNWQLAHLEACRQAEAVYTVSVPGPAALVIASCGGFPKDINMIQAHKSLDNAYRAVAANGVLVLLAECGQGLGSQDFVSWFNYPDTDTMAQAVREKYSIHGHTALTCRAKAQSRTVILVSSLNPGLVRKMGMIPASNMQEALKAAYSVLNTEHPKTYIFPYGSLTVPQDSSRS